MTRAERLELLADLRAMGVEEAHFHGGAMAFVKFFAPAPPAAATVDDRPPPRKRTLDERLMHPLGIGEEKPGGDG